MPGGVGRAEAEAGVPTVDVREAVEEPLGEEPLDACVAVGLAAAAGDDDGDRAAALGVASPEGATPCDAVEDAVAACVGLDPGDRACVAVWLGELDAGDVGEGESEPLCATPP